MRTKLPAWVVRILFVLRFKVPASVGVKATAGTYPITITEVAASSATSTALAAGGTGGSINLNDFKRQDVNHDGSVNVVDVQMCVNIILHTFTPTYPNQGDCNSDNLVNVVDVQNIVNCILNPNGC